MSTSKVTLQFSNSNQLWTFLEVHPNVFFMDFTKNIVTLECTHEKIEKAINQFEAKVVELDKKNPD